MKDTIRESFENRLIKMERHQGKWARKNRLDAYRIYDRDIPGAPFSVDRYGEHLYVCEYSKAGDDEDSFATVRRDVALESISTALDTPAERIHLKSRERKRGKTQYEKFGEGGSFFTVREGDLQFYVNLDDYLDTGLFLDHRITRSMVREASSGRDMLNLFAYTGSFSVYAASGGAKSTTTVDLSNTYLDWAENNFKLNGIDPSAPHRFIKADVLAFMESEKKSSYDLIVADVPTFSNSKSTETVFDVQRDQGELMHLLLRLLRPGGILYFSTNFRRFKPEPEWFERPGVKEITKSTIPRDFRNEKIHRCFRVVMDQG